MKRKKGFTIIEVVMALGIIAIGIVSILPLFSLGLKMSKNSVKRTEAVFILKNIVEQEKAKGFNTADVGLARTALPASDKMPGSQMKNMFKEIQILNRNNAERWFEKRVIISWDYVLDGTTKTKQISADIMILDM